MFIYDGSGTVDNMHITSLNTVHLAMFARPLAMLDQHCTWHTQGMPEAGSTGASGRGRDAGGAGAGAFVLLILGFSSCKFDPKCVVNLGGSAFRTFDTGQISFLCEIFSTQLACRGAGVKWAEIRSKSGQVEFT